MIIKIYCNNIFLYLLLPGFLNCIGLARQQKMDNRPRHERLGSYKRRSAGLDRRRLRSHNKTLEQKKNRDATVNNRRPNFDKLTPVKSEVKKKG